ncbi:hypothetical protein EQV77_03030 [Halobacillus fulvus]|nr:hypothetical protein EQV77_03030 [Halobacillus fulvus]
MGRALVIIGISLVLALLLSVQATGMQSEQKEWKAFSDQYKYLIQDQKQSLADQLLHNRLNEMGKYIETQPELVRLAWSDMKAELEAEPNSPLHKERFFVFIDSLVNDDPVTFTKSQLKEFQMKVVDVTVSEGVLQEDWQRISPVVQAHFGQEETFRKLNLLVDSLSVDHTIEMREDVSEQIDLLYTKKNMEEALFWTAVLIGGTIIVTLIYVSCRKYAASRKKANSRSENS